MSTAPWPIAWHISTDIAPRIAGALDELVAGATDRVEVRPADAKSGAYFERLRVDGVPHFLKVVSATDDMAAQSLLRVR